MALAINGTPVHSSLTGTSITSPTFTTTAANCIIIVAVIAEQFPTAPVVTSVTATGLTFALRKAINLSGLVGNCGGDLEVWWALASSTFSGTITANLSFACDDNCIGVFAVSGADTVNPWDPSSTSPTNSAITNTVPTVTSALSTSNANSMLLGFAASGSPGGTVTQTAGALGGTTGTLDINEENNGGSNSSALAVEHRIVSAAQTNVSVAFGAAYHDNWFIIADAIQAPGSGATAAGQGKTPPLVFRPGQGPSRGLRTPRSTDIILSTVIPAGAAITPPRIFRPKQGPSRGLTTLRSTFIPIAGLNSVDAAGGLTVGSPAFTAPTLGIVAPPSTLSVTPDIVFHGDDVFQTTSVNIHIPSGITAGMFMVIGISFANGNSSASIAGHTSATAWTAFSAIDSGSNNKVAFYKIADAGDAADSATGGLSWTLTCSDGFLEEWAGAAWSGVDNTTPFATGPSSNHTNATTTFTFTSQASPGSSAVWVGLLVTNPNSGTVTDPSSPVVKQVTGTSPSFTGKTIVYSATGVTGGFAPTGVEPSGFDWGTVGFFLNPATAGTVSNLTATTPLSVGSPVFVAPTMAVVSARAISLVQAKFQDFSGTSGSITLNSPMTAGSFLVIAGMFDNVATSVTIIDDKGDALTDSGFGFVNNASIGARHYVKAFLTATAGAQTITITPNASLSYANIYVWEWAGIASPVFDKVVTQSIFGPNPTSGSTGTLSSANEAAIGYSDTTGN